MKIAQRKRDAFGRQASFFLARHILNEAANTVRRCVIGNAKIASPANCPVVNFQYSVAVGGFQKLFFWFRARLPIVADWNQSFELLQINRRRQSAGTFLQSGGVRVPTLFHCNAHCHRHAVARFGIGRRDFNANSCRSRLTPKFGSFLVDESDRRRRDFTSGISRHCLQRDVEVLLDGQTPPVVAYLQLDRSADSNLAEIGIGANSEHALPSDIAEVLFNLLFKRLVEQGLRCMIRRERFLTDRFETNRVPDNDFRTAQQFGIHRIGVATRRNSQLH